MSGRRRTKRRNVPGAFLAITAPEVDGTDRAQVQEIYWQHWRYNRADPSFRRLLSTTPLYAQWDDHEVINDFGALWTAWPHDPRHPGFSHLVASGRAAFFHYKPPAPTTASMDV